jgi:hypothetical protein
MITPDQALEELQTIILQLDAEGDHVRRNQLVEIGRVFRDMNDKMRGINA